MNRIESAIASAKNVDLLVPIEGIVPKEPPKELAEIKKITRECKTCKNANTIAHDLPCKKCSIINHAMPISYYASECKTCNQPETAVPKQPFQNSLPKSDDTEAQEASHNEAIFCEAEAMAHDIMYKCRGRAGNKAIKETLTAIIEILTYYKNKL